MSVVKTTYHWPHHSFHAMGTRIDAWIEAPPEQAAPALAQVETLFRDVEASLSRFIPASELSLLNGQPETWVPVSKTLWSVLTIALQYAEETAGMFDPTLLAAIRAAGYRESFEYVKGDKAIEPRSEPLTTGGWREIRLDARRRRVWLPEGSGLDFGGIAKGYTAQWATLLMGLWGPCLVDAGGDLVAGDAPAGLPGWPVTILAPHTGGRGSGRALVSLTMANNALATSGVDHRRWTVGGHEAHHLIDPVTARPANSDALTVSVMAPNGSAAEVWSKVALIEGSSGLPALSKRGIPALIITRDGALHFNAEMWSSINGFDTNAKIILPAGELHSQAPGQRLPVGYIFR